MFSIMIFALACCYRKAKRSRKEQNNQRLKKIDQMAKEQDAIQNGNGNKPEKRFSFKFRMPEQIEENKI
jgi:hypothetical protein